MKQRCRNGKIDGDGGGIHEGRDKRRGHEGRIQPAAFCQHGQAAADKLRQSHRADQRHSDKGRQFQVLLIHNINPDSVNDCQGAAHQRRHPDLLPDDPEGIF